ncbi:MAG: hypothetical protein J7J07_06315 [Syntrophobacterales bacterium]|nr:hypothetical protein [Syntrophobacterales bacterium]
MGTIHVMSYNNNVLSHFYQNDFLESQKTPSPLMGEGRGEGEYSAISSSYVPLPFIPSHEGRGNLTFYRFIIF